MRNYLVRGSDCNGDSLDWVVTAESLPQAIELWRAYLKTERELDPEDIEMSPFQHPLPAISDRPMVHDWLFAEDD
jgi:hypothetical protein